MAEHSREEMKGAQERMMAVFPAVRARLQAIPGVVQIGIGIKETGAQPTGEPAFGVYVREKKPLEDVAPEERIPAEIEGFATDVRVYRRAKREEDTGKYRPLEGGIQIKRAGSDEAGTIACFGHRDTPAGEPILLTAGHVVGLPQDDTPAGLLGGDNDGIEIGQHTHTDSWCCKCHVVGFTLHGVNHKTIDFAIVQLNSDITTINNVHEIGPVDGIFTGLTMGDMVKKRGRTTGFTTGNVSMLIMNAAGTAVEQIEVKRNGGNERFSRPGDSGSALLNATNAIVGIHYGGNNTDADTAPNFVSWSTPIQLVLDTAMAHGFPITITATGVIGDEDELEMTVAAARTDLMWALELRLRQTERGRELWSIIDRHQREILRLVNRERAVTVVWRRNQGPAFIAAMGRSLKEPTFRIPEEMNGVSRQRLIIAMATMLDAHGSEALRSTLAEHRALLQEVLIGGGRAEEMVRMWETAAVAAAVSE